MHKIDRENLKCWLDYDAGCYPPARANETIRKAAENWLEISDPGYISLFKSICNVLDDTAKRFQGTPDDDDADLESASRTYSAALKAMIAKAGG